VYAARGYRAFYLGNIGKAQDCYDEAIRLWPHDPAYFNFRGFIWHMKGIGSWGRSGCEDLALADYADALDLDPAFAPALNNRAWLLATTTVARCRNGARAVEEATRACELSGWANAGYLDTLSVAYAEVGDFDEAAWWQLKALEYPQYQRESGRIARKKLALFKRRKPFRE
jgi:Flp pilus assembly protein TadD